MKAVKFTFDNRFDAPPKQKKEEEEPQEAPPVFSSDDIEAARQAAFADGVEAGRTEAFTDISERTAQAVAEVAAAAKALLGEHEGRAATAREDAVAIGHAIARTLAPALSARNPLTEIEAMVKECLTVCYSEPRLVVRVAEDLVEPMKELIDQITYDQNFGGKVILLGDDRLTGDHCRVEWADGGAERDTVSLQAEVDRLVDRYMNNMTTQTPSVTDEPSQDQAQQNESENGDVE